MTLNRWAQVLVVPFFVGAVLFGCDSGGAGAGDDDRDAASPVPQSVQGQHDAHDGHNPEHEHQHHHHEALAADKPLDDQSVFHLDATWRDQDAEEFPWQSLRGNPTVVVMFFATCTDACPLLVNDVKRLQTALPDEVVDDLQIIFVTFDTERDTPDVLRKYGDDRGIDFSQWSLLHGTEGQVRELAAVLGVRYRKQNEGDFMHSNVITVLDREGRILHRTEGLGKPVDAAVKKLSSRN